MVHFHCDVMWFTFPRTCSVRAEMQGTAQLVSDNEELSQSLVNLLLTGRATPHLHNDTIIYDDDGELLV